MRDRPGDMKQSVQYLYRIVSEYQTQASASVPSSLLYLNQYTEKTIYY